MRLRGFTLIELMVVIVMMSLLAAVVTPGLGAMRDTQRAAGVDEVRRMLRTAQQYARATGRPHGLWVDCASDRSQLVQLNSDGSVSPALDGLGSAVRIRALGNDFVGLDLKQIDAGNGTQRVNGIVWFDYLGHPEIRELDGTLPRAVTTEPKITFVDYGTILIDRVTGVLR